MVNCRLSETRLNKCGIPQGTVFGAVLFLFFINDLLLLVNDDNIVIFADDRR